MSNVPERFDMVGELLGSVLIDVMGLVSYVIPGVGEFSDIATAPITVYWILEMLTDVDNVSEDSFEAQAFAVFGGLEELAPVIDIIPSATMAWVYKWRYMK